MRCENIGGRDATMQMLYHFNIGQPLLQPGARITAPVGTVAPWTQVAARSRHRALEHHAAAAAGSAEQGYLVDLLADDAGETRVLLSGLTDDEAVSLRFNKTSLPCFTLWRNTAAEADGYVLGLEPATNYSQPAPFEKQHGRVVTLNRAKLARRSDGDLARRCAVDRRRRGSHSRDSRDAIKPETSAAVLARPIGRPIRNDARLRCASRLDGYCDFNPLAALGAGQHGVAHFLRFECFAECRRRRLVLRHAVEEVGHLVDERVFVADLQARHPPLVHVGHVAVGDVDAAPAADERLVAVVEVAEAVQVVQVPGDRGIGAVDLERVERLVAAGVARRFEDRRASRWRSGTGTRRHRRCRPARPCPIPCACAP